VELSDVGHAWAGPVVLGLSVPGGLVGGGLAVYDVYAVSDGHIALAALEPHFTTRLLTELGVEREDLSRERLAEVFISRTAADWQQWANERDIPLAAVAAPSA
jgi:crotonobetainyl-CoA:carnitine CoA-transferase CaiB-like acyl-CoA transferase